MYLIYLLNMHDLYKMYMKLGTYPETMFASQKLWN